MSRALFATMLYEAELGDPALLDDLAHSVRTLATDDHAGRRWSRDKGYKGYTSYASLNDLPRRADAPDELKPFATIAPRPGLLLLWESWLRHEVLPGTARTDRLSVSFNFA